MSDWQKIMVEYCGKEWAVKQLRNVEVFKMAEDFNRLKEENKLLKTIISKSKTSGVTFKEEEFKMVREIKEQGK